MDATEKMSFEAEALAHLRALTARTDAQFHDGQLEAIRALVEERRRVLVVERTGWGKSAVYFIATRMLRDRAFGATLLVSPLISLMDNQVEAAGRMGLRAAVVNSTNHDAWDEIQERLDSGEIDLLLISEMRLANDQFRRDWLPKLGGRIGLVVIDEVHCISDWGHDFRPNYRRIGSFLQLLPAGAPVIGCTATANDRVVADVQSQRGVGLLTIRGPLGRDGLRLEVHTDKRRPDARLAWLATNVPDLPGSGVVYCLTRRDVELVADFLRGYGIQCGTYVGGGSPDDNAGKVEVLRQFVANELKCVVATSALGMGYDKPDVGFVIHFQSPQSAIAYYQQVGRAGRQLDMSYGILLAGSEDRDIQDWFITQAFPHESEVDAVLGELAEAEGPVRIGQLAARVNIGTGRLDNLLVQLDVEGAVEKSKAGWARTDRAWEYPRDRVDQVNAWRREEQAAMEHYASLESCRMQHLRRQLDDPQSDPCGICDNCRGERFGHDPDLSIVGVADDRLRDDPAELAPRKRWPTGLADISGNIPVEERFEPGWSLAAAGSGGWAQAARSGIGSGDFDEDLLEALAALVRDRTDIVPAWVTHVPSVRRSGAVAALADGVAERLGVPSVILLDRVGDERPPQSAMHNSGAQLMNVVDAFRVAGAVPPGPGVLIDDLGRSRWTLTVAARLLRLAGAESVTPLVLLDSL